MTRAQPRPAGTLTTTEAAAALGLAPPSVRAAIRRGTLEALRLSVRRTVVTREAVEQYRREHLEGGGWVARRQPDYRPSPNALRLREKRRQARLHRQRRARADAAPR